MLSCCCLPCARELAIERAELLSRKPCPPLPSAAGSTLCPVGEMLRDRARWLHDVAGWTYAQIAGHYNDRGLRTLSRRRPWNYGSVHYLVKRRRWSGTTV